MDQLIAIRLSSADLCLRLPLAVCIAVESV